MHRTQGARDAAALIVLLCALSFGACNSEVTAVPEPGTIDPDTAFEAADVVPNIVKREVHVTLRSVSGATMKRVRVEWIARDGGRAIPATSITDSAGVATTVWTLGPENVPHAIEAHAIGYRTRTIRSNLRLSEFLPLDRVMSLDLATYDGSGQTVHPDYLRIDGVKTPERMLAITPYRSGNTSYENPSVYTAPDDFTWRAPAFARNPVVMPTQRYLSDPDLVYDPVRQEVLLYFREVGEENTIWLIRSKDGATWTSRERVVSGPSHEVVSPAVVRRGPTEWLMWAVNAHSGCSDAQAELELRRSTDGVTWLAPETVKLDQGGFMPWHVDVQWMPSRNEYWAVYNVKSPGSCNTTAAYFATSDDGVTWKTYPSPLVVAGFTRALEDIVYRATFYFDPVTDIITFWYSGARYDGSNFVWNTVAQRRRRGDVFTQITSPRASSAPSGFGPLRKVPAIKRPP